MQIITVINAKGGCGKSTIAMSLASGLAQRGFSTLLIDMDPQAQVTQWLALGDGLSSEGTLVSAMEGTQKLDDVVQPTAFENLSFIPSSQGLEDLGRQITDLENYATVFTGRLAMMQKRFEFIVIDSPNQISPVMENAIFPSDAFIVPFESTKAVRSYANFFQLLMRLRPGEEHRVLHVLSNLSRQRGLRQRVIDAMARNGLACAKTEIHTCGWLAQVDENGGNIFKYRPYSRGAQDMALLVQEVLELLGSIDAKGAQALATAPNLDAVQGNARTAALASAASVEPDLNAAGAEIPVPSPAPAGKPIPGPDHPASELPANPQHHDQTA
jgi:chromosome partitioning protein